MARPGAGRAAAAMFGLFAGGMLVMTMAIPPASRHFASLLPENYQYIARRAMSKGNTAEALAIADKRLSTAYYDFQAHFVKADALEAAGRHAEAAAEMKLVIRKLPAARAKGQPLAGFDEPRTLSRMAVMLWNAGEHFEAAEMARAALDAGSPYGDFAFLIDEAGKSASGHVRMAAASIALKQRDREAFSRLMAGPTAVEPEEAARWAVLRAAWLETAEGDTTAAMATLASAWRAIPGDTLVGLAYAGALERDGHGTSASEVLASASAAGRSRVIPFNDFSLPEGASLSGGVLSMPRNGAAEGSVTPGVFRATVLALRARGTQALGGYPILAISDDTGELARLYLDGPQPAAYLLPLWPEGAPKSMKLKFEFLNDLYEPVTKADRNVTVLDALLQ